MNDPEKGPALGPSRFILASASPRRKRLLLEAGWSFEVIPADLPEEPLPGEDPEAYALRMAESKALKVAKRHLGRWVLGADTMVVLPRNQGRERLLGKPTSEEEAADMLRALSGRTHLVTTAVAFVRLPSAWSARDQRPPRKGCSFLVTSAVTFRSLSDWEIRNYVKTGEPMDKAGAYAIQEGARGFVKSYSGSWSNIVGLPIEAVSQWLRDNLRC